MDLPRISTLLGLMSDDVVSASLFGRLSVSFGTIAQQTVFSGPEQTGSDVQRFDVKDKLVTAFQLESLILAQNERWRQA